MNCPVSPGGGTVGRVRTASAMTDHPSDRSRTNPVKMLRTISARVATIRTIRPVNRKRAILDSVFGIRARPQRCARGFEVSVLVIVIEDDAPGRIVTCRRVGSIRYAREPP